MSMEYDGNTRVLGLFGNPVKQSASPAMHNAAFEALKLNCIYLPFEVRPENLEGAVASLRALNFLGVNLTVPHKQDVIPYLDGISGDARLIGAVNTIKVEGKRLIGHNTDGRGFVRALDDNAGFSVHGKNVVLIGAGGAGRAVAVQCGLDGAAHITITDEQHTRSQSLASHIVQKIPGTDALSVGIKDAAFAERMADADLTVDATPLGMQSSDPTSFDPDLLPKRSVVVDLVYNPPETKLLRAAKKRGCKAFNGMGILLDQGAIAFEIWTKKKAPVEIMRKALIKAIR